MPPPMMAISTWRVASGLGKKWPSRTWWQMEKRSLASLTERESSSSARSALSIGQPEAMEPATTYLMKSRRDGEGFKFSVISMQFQRDRFSEKDTFLAAGDDECVYGLEPQKRRQAAALPRKGQLAAIYSVSAS